MSESKETVKQDIRAELAALVRRDAGRIRDQQEKIPKCKRSPEVLRVLDQVDGIVGAFEESAEALKRYAMRCLQTFRLDTEVTVYFIQARAKVEAAAEYAEGFGDAYKTILNEKETNR